MAKPSVYIETTVISYLTAWPSGNVIRAAHQQITKEWWDKRRGDFELFVSEFVAQECSAGNAEAAQQRLTALADIPSLDANEAIEQLARSLIARQALPAKAATDALHIAAAAVHNVEFLLTWNCKHIANAQMLNAIETVCREQGYKCPRICTPEELLGDQADEG